MSDRLARAILVTGAGSGMGRVATRVFAGDGDHVVALDFDGDALAETLDEIGSDFWDTGAAWDPATFAPTVPYEPAPSSRSLVMQ